MSIIYTEGKSRATIDFKTKTSGVHIEFDNVENPQFIAKVGKLVDEFMWTDKTLDECFKIDTFEKRGE